MARTTSLLAEEYPAILAPTTLYQKQAGRVIIIEGRAREGREVKMMQEGDAGQAQEPTYRVRDAAALQAAPKCTMMTQELKSDRPA